MSGTYNVMRQTKGSATKIPVSCSNIIKFFNNDMVGVNIMDCKTAVYRLDCKSKYLFYLGMFFDFIDVAIVKVTLFTRKLVYSLCKRFFPTSRPNMRKSHKLPMHREVPTHMPDFQKKQKRRHYYKNEGLDHKTFIHCQTCGLYLCLTKEANCFLKHHF